MPLSRRYALVAAALLAALGAVGFLHVRSEGQRFRDQAERKLSAIADLKVSQLVAWRGERLADASVLTDDRLVARALRSLAAGSAGTRVVDDCRAWLLSLARNYDYTAAVLVDRDGRALVAAGTPPAPAHVAGHLADAFRERRAMLTDFEREEAAGDVHLDLVAPIFDPDRPSVALGGVVLRVDPATFLYPLVQSWPAPTASAESLLVRREGDEVVFLNEPRHRKAPPLTIRLPLSDRRYTAVRAVAGERGVMSGIDYRGVEVLAAGRPIPGTDWALLAKVDAAEILAPGAEQARRLGFIVLLLMASAGAAIALGWRHRAAVLERARLEAARAREAHARHLELLSEHANDVVLLIDHAGRIVRANDRVRDCHGWSPEELVGLHMREMRAPGHSDDLAAHIAQIRREGHLRYETVHRRRDGTTFPVEVSARGFEARGEWFFQAIVRDISDRKEALRALSYQAELLRNLHEAVIGLDAQQVIRSWNTAAERIYGFAAGEVMGKHIREALPSEYEGFSSYPEFIEALDRNGRMNFEVRRRHRNGSWIDAEAAAVVLRGDDGRISGYVSLNRDVTLRKHAEAALRANQERLARILDTSNDGLWIVDDQGRTEFVNDRAARLFGATPDELVGTPFFDGFPEPENAQARRDIEALVSGASVQRELSIRHRDGSERWLQLSAKPLREQDGRVAGAVAVFMDVTEQRRAREQLIHAQKMEAVGRLASGVAHDFNNLLVAILSCSRFLLENLPEGDPLRAEAVDIHKAGERAAQLVRQLLAFGRKGAGRPAALDVDAVVRQLETILRRAAGERVSISLSLGASWPTRIDPGHLEQVLMNLAVNARDAMPSGGQLRIVTRDAVLDAAPAGAPLAPGRYSVLTVTDTGSGIEPDVLPRIFEPFFTTKPEGRGTGLGLSTVYGIVQDAGGTIEVASVVGRGTTFTVYLPAAAEATVPAVPALLPSRANEPRPGATILVVDDEETVRRIARRMLEAHGFRVVETGSAAEALRRVHEDGSVDVVLTDVAMPQGAGTELMSALGAIRPGLPVVLMSGCSAVRTVAGAGEVLHKPFTAEALVARVDEALHPPRALQRAG